MLSQLLPTSIIANKILCLAKSEQKHLEKSVNHGRNFINLTIKLTIFIALLLYLNFRFFDW